MRDRKLDASGAGGYRSADVIAGTVPVLQGLGDLPTLLSKAMPQTNESRVVTLLLTM